MDSYANRAASEPHYWNNTIEQATGRAFDWQCPFCSANLLEVGYIRAHISPVGTGVGIVLGNIVLSCVRCNSSMGNNHAFTWCQWRGIDFGHIASVLDVLRKVFAREIEVGFGIGDDDMRQVRLINAPNMKTKRVIDWLLANPDKRNWSIRQISSELGVSKSWVAVAINRLSAP